MGTFFFSFCLFYPRFFFTSPPPPLPPNKKNKRYCGRPTGHNFGIEPECNFLSGLIRSCGQSTGNNIDSMGTFCASGLVHNVAITEQKGENEPPDLTWVVLVRTTPPPIGSPANFIINQRRIQGAGAGGGGVKYHHSRDKHPPVHALT